MAETLSFRVDGLRELLRVTDQLPKEVKMGVRNELRRVAEPVRDEAQRRFLSEITADTRKSKYGISVRRAGTITVEQRVKSKYSRGNKKLKRTKFTTAQLEILATSLKNNEAEILAGFNRVLDGLERRWAVGR